MINLKILFFDIDGTLSDELTGTIPESSAQAIKKAQENGHLCFVNTGRPISSVDNDIKALGMDGYVCGCGSYIEYKGEILLKSVLPKEKCKEIVKKVVENNIFAVLEGTDGVYWDPNNTHPQIKFIQEKYTECGFDMSKTWFDEDLSYDKMACWITEESSFEPFYDYVKDDFTVIKRADDFYEIIQKEYSKATGIQFLLNHFNLKLEDAFAFGDSTNDLSMLEYVKNSIGMGNSSQEVLEKVSFVTKNIEEDGIAYAMKHFGII